MLPKLEHTMSNLDICSARSPCVIGVSGGPDSVALAHCLHTLGHDLMIAHFNHMLRPNANNDASVVKDFSESIGVEYFYGEGSVSDHANSQSISIEEAARELRYRFLFDTAANKDAPAILVAHTADDQVETVIMHLLRGAGLSGLRGMKKLTSIPKYHQHINLVRPALDVWRSEVVQYCKDNNLTTIEDVTNLDVNINRNRIRHELIPYLEDYNPKIKQAIWRTANTLTGDSEFLSDHIDACALEITSWNSNDFSGIDLNKFLNHTVGIQRGVLRHLISKLRMGLRDINYESIERALDFARHPPRSRTIELTNHLYLLIELNTLWIFDHLAKLPTNTWPQMNQADILLEVPSSVKLEHGWILNVELIQGELEMSDVLENRDVFSAWMSMDQFSENLMLRRKKTGDRFQPLGVLHGSQKLKDSFINAKIPRRARDNWPVLACGNAVHWIPGYRQSQQSRLTSRSNSILRLKMTNQ